MSKDNQPISWPTLILVVGIFAFFWWANQPTESTESDYTLPPLEGKPRGYKEGKWVYYEQQQQRTYTQSQVDSIRRYAKNMKADEFEEAMEDYIQDNDWGE